MQLVREAVSAERWSQARNILAVRLDNLGDVLMTTPALRAIKESDPRRRITLLASEAGAEAARAVSPPNDLPHSLQNLARAWFACPQAPHRRTVGAPHSLQNLLPSAMLA